MTGLAYSVNLFCLDDLDALRLVKMFELAELAGRCNILYLVRESGEVTIDWERLADHVREIWVTSRSAQDAIGMLAPFPVLHFPLPDDNATKALESITPNVMLRKQDDLTPQSLGRRIRERLENLGLGFNADATRS